MKLNYRQRLTLWFCLIFALFALGIILIGKSQAKSYKTEALEEKLDAYSDVVSNYIRRSTVEEVNFDSLLTILPGKIRITWISKDGIVLYDNVLDSQAQQENHAQRPEIIAAMEKGRGSNIRLSASNQVEYMYYAKSYNNYVIRVALPYDIQTRYLLQPDNAFLYYILAFFLIGIIFINYVARHFGRSIQKLRDFSVSIHEVENDNEIPDFPDDELGDIGRKIVLDYKRLKRNEYQMMLERDKLLQHIQSSSEGICFFTPEGKPVFYNGLFMQFLNTLAGVAPSYANKIFEQDIFREVKEFLENPQRKESYFETVIDKGGNKFLIKINVFEDKSFELVLNKN